jgi:hypothetical protein
MPPPPAPAPLPPPKLSEKLGMSFCRFLCTSSLSVFTGRETSGEKIDWVPLPATERLLILMISLNILKGNRNYSRRKRCHISRSIMFIPMCTKTKTDPQRPQSSTHPIPLCNIFLIPQG